MDERCGITAVTFLVGSFFAPVARCDEPSLQDTVDWLTGKITKEAGYRYKTQWTDNVTMIHTMSYSVTESDSGVFVATETYVYRIHEPGEVENVTRSTTTMEFLLKEFDPDKCQTSDRNIHYINTAKGETLADGESGYYILTLHAMNDKPIIKYHNSTTQTNEPETNKDETSYKLGICFADKTMADRVAKAFAHAIRLSGGKATKEPF